MRSGITNPTSISVLQKWTRFGRSDICKFIKQLVEAGMLEKLPRKGNEAQAYQLYPRPYAEKRERTPEQEWVGKPMVRIGDYVYSHNWQYRINVKTGDIQYRKSRRKKWKFISDYHRSQKMPKAILEDFGRVRDLHLHLEANLDE